MAVRNPGGSVGAESIGTAQLANGAVTEPKIGANQVTSSRLVKPGAAPAKPAEKAIILTTGSPARKVTAAVTGDGAKTEWAIAHSLETTSVMVVGYKAAAEAVGENEVLANVTWKPVSTNETTVKTSAAIGAGVEFFFAFWG